MDKRDDRQMEGRLYWAEKWSSVSPGSTPPPGPPTPTYKKVLMEIVQKSFYYINRIVSTFNRIESLSVIVILFLIEIYLNNFFKIVIVLTSIRLKKIVNRNPLMQTKAMYVSSQKLKKIQEWSALFFLNSI